ncbi:MAG: GNAT family N-acetyltransferase [Chloroflexi bacterium]|nr:GNAT family N-acetyltransferase [Chloroflexota bacterium]
MTAQQMTTDKLVLRDLGDGLIVRSGRPEDTEELAALNAQIFCDHNTKEPNEKLAWWTRDLATRHPTVQVSDFTVVEDTRNSKIVSSFVWISQRWSYSGIEFGVGRPEMVGTLPDYRNRGVIRAQFQVAHEWSAQRGEMLQGITGIPFFYRQFGYEMTMNLGGGREGYKPQVPKLKEGEAEPYNIRPAGEADMALIADLYARRGKRHLVDCVRDDTMWQYELAGKSEKNVNRAEYRIVETPQGEAVGVVAHSPNQWGQTMAAVLYELKPGVSWVAVSPSVIRYLWATGEAYAARDKKNEMSAFLFDLGEQHPVYDAMRDHMPKVNKPYAWYIRVPDVVRVPAPHRAGAGAAPGRIICGRAHGRTQAQLLPQRRAIELRAGSHQHRGAVEADARPGRRRRIPRLYVPATAVRPSLHGGVALRLRGLLGRQQRQPRLARRAVPQAELRRLADIVNGVDPCGVGQADSLPYRLSYTTRVGGCISSQWHAIRLPTLAKVCNLRKGWSGRAL